MRAANPAIPPQMAVMANPRTGSSTFMASKAPPTAPKNDAAHARKGVSSHPKIRKNRRSHRMSSGPASSYSRDDRGEHECGQKGDCERAQTPTCSRKSESHGQSRYDQSGGDGQPKPDQRYWPTAAG